MRYRVPLPPLDWNGEIRYFDWEITNNGCSQDEQVFTARVISDLTVLLDREHVRFDGGTVRIRPCYGYVELEVEILVGGVGRLRFSKAGNSWAEHFSSLVAESFAREIIYALDNLGYFRRDPDTYTYGLVGADYTYASSLDYTIPFETTRPYSKQDDAADKKAEKLLLSYLNKKQKKSYKKNGHFTCFGGETGTEYRINKKMQINVDVLDEDGRPSGVRLCAVPDENIPICDHMLSLLLMIETNESHFLEVAHKWGGHGTGFLDELAININIDPSAWNRAMLSVTQQESLENGYLVTGRVDWRDNGR